MKISLSFTFDECCFSGYYGGHGHAFTEENQIACIHGGFPVNYSEKVGELVKTIMEKIRGSDWDILTETEDKTRKELDMVTDEQIRAAILDSLDVDMKVWEKRKYYGMNTLRRTKDVELPTQFFYLHVFAEEGCKYGDTKDGTCLTAPDCQTPSERCAYRS